MSPLERYLADSNRRTRFCRPLPSHSAKVPFDFASAKLQQVFGTAKHIAYFLIIFIFYDTRLQADLLFLFDYITFVTELIIYNLK